MLRLAFAFFVFAIAATVLGFMTMGPSAMFFSRIMIVVFLILSVMTLMIGKLQS
ncbi:MAG: DUF1328 domain-containing protein [Candidatus Omnitrophica bacterium]|nr:DUF1328 domain-containing protein [Candidatus Omnitrophota bacterium]